MRQLAITLCRRAEIRSNETLLSSSHTHTHAHARIRARSARSVSMRFFSAQNAARVKLNYNGAQKQRADGRCAGPVVVGRKGVEACTG